MKLYAQLLITYALVPKVLSTQRCYHLYVYLSQRPFHRSDTGCLSLNCAHSHQTEEDTREWHKHTT